MAGSERSEDLESWVRTQGGALMRFAYLMSGDRERAAEAVQDALVAAYPRWSHIVERGNPGAYLRRAVVNADTSRWRRYQRREHLSADPHRLTDQLVVTDPAQAVVLEDAVWQLCLTLPARQRAAVILRFYDDRADSEIADILGCSTSTVRSQIHRGIAALREQLAAEKEATGS